MTAMIRSEHVIEITYLVATALFILSLKWMSSPSTARRGVRAGELGMLLAIGGTLLHHGIVDYKWIAIALVLGTIIGVPLGLVQMTAVPQRTALSHAFGALCVTLVGTAEFYLQAPDVPRFTMAVLSLEVILGSLTFTGSLMAAGKLQEILPQRPITYKGQNLVNLSLLGRRRRHRRLPGPASRRRRWLFPLMIVIAAGLRRADDHPDRRRRHADGHLAAQLLRRTVRRGDGIRAQQQAADHRRRARRGVGLHPVGHHVEGDEPLVHQRAVRRLRPGAGRGRGGAGSAGRSRSATAEEAAAILAAANKVVIVPGYGMAVAQAQHKVRELYDALTKRGVDVKFAIHPVAGRMPGHMNVLLAEADIPYDQLLDMDDINGDFPQTDVALVIGANDVTNPAARTDAVEPDLRHADPRRGQGAHRDGDQARHEPGLRRHRQSALLPRQDADALRRRPGVRGRDRARAGRRRSRLISPSAQILRSLDSCLPAA